ncbi:hypothetical protein [Candidatus Corynebacterium faecigallinarum]|uniref:hypothetical protein n=1 Tax=Candidatus Corynebacterium faecigallinarum TaxID=2838528 RepID=UPI003FD01773
MTDPVAYSVNVDAQKTSTGWELTLDNGRQLQVTTLDEAATRIRTLLDIYQPAVNHDTVTVTLAISPTAAPAKTAAPSVAGASRTSARASAASSTTGARTPSATSAAARTTTSSAAVTPAASRSATSSRTATATPSARTATSTQSTPVARPATTSRAPHTTTSPRTTTQSPAASTRFSTTSSSTSTPAAASARPAATGSTASASARPSATASARPAATARPATATAASTPAASTRSASTRTTANPPATDYASVGPSGLECTLWLTAAKEKHPSFSDAAIEVFPWINTLPAEQRRRCLGDIHVGLKRATEEYAYSELRDTVSRWRKISAAPPVTPTAPHNEVRPTTSTPASPARSSFGNYPAAIHRISAAAATPAAASRPATSAASAPHGSQGSPIDLNPQGRHRL